MSWQDVLRVSVYDRGLFDDASGLFLCGWIEGQMRLEEAQEYLQIIYDNIPMGICFLTPELDIVFVNAFIEEKLGLELKDIKGKKCYDVIGQYKNHTARKGIDRICDECAALKAVETGVTQKITREVRPDYVVEITCVPIRDKTGKVRNVLEMVHDITEQKIAERALQESETRYRILTENIKDVVWTADLDLNLTYVSPSVKNLLGYEPPEVTGNNLERCIPSDYSGRVRTVLQEEFRKEMNEKGFDERSRTLELPVAKKSGEVIWVEANMSFLRDKSGRAAGILGVTRDISKRKEAEAILLSSRSRLEHLLSASPAVIYTCKPFHGYEATFVSDNVEKVLGYSSNEFTKNAEFWATHIHPDDAERALAEVASVFENGYHVHEYRFLDKKGYYKWIRDELRLVRDADGTAVEIIGCFIDITERKEMEESLRDSERRLRCLSTRLLNAQETERKRLSIELHDELGQTLAFLKMHIRSLEKALSERHLSLKKECEEAIDYVNQVISRVRRLSKDLSPPILDDLGLVETVRCMAEEFARKYSMQLFFDMPSVDLGLSREAQINIYRIFQEALTNVAKHASATRVEIAAHQEESFVTFGITDNGKGFDSDEGAEKSFLGKGMGLATMKERVRMLGGEIEFSSESGKGTRIVFRVPRNRGLDW